MTRRGPRATESLLDYLALAAGENVADASFKSRLGSFLARPGTIVVVAFLIRFGIYYHLRSHGPYPISQTLPFGYETGRIARALAAGEGYSSPLNVDTGPTAWMTPLFPLLLAAIFKIFGIYSWSSWLVITTINCAFSALTAWPIHAIGTRAFGKATGVTAAWMWTFLRPAIFYPVFWVWDMSMAALVFALILLATTYMKDSERPGAWAGYGALWGFGALTNAAMVSTLPFLMGWLALRLRARCKRWMQLVAASLMMFALVISPWFVRNYTAFHKLILFRDNFGLELWLGNNVENPGIWSGWLHPNDNDAERALFKKLGELGYMDLKQRQAVEWIKAHPAEFVQDTAHRFIDNWTGLDEPIVDVLRGPWYEIGSVILAEIFPLLVFPGVLLASRRRNPYTVPFAAVVLVFPLVYYITHTSLRYRHPMDPLLCVLASYALATPVAWWVTRRAGAQAEASGASGAGQVSSAS